MFDITIITIINSTTNILNYSTNLSMLFNVVTNANTTITSNNMDAYKLYCASGLSNGYILKHTLQFRILTAYPNNTTIN